MSYNSCILFSKSFFSRISKLTDVLDTIYTDFTEIILKLAYEKDGRIFYFFQNQCILYYYTFSK